jgi:hypothetical protein
MTNRISCLLAGVLLTIGTLSAQQHQHGEWCGVTGKSEWIKKFQAGEIPIAQKSLNVQYLPLRLVIVGRDDGSGYISPTQVLSSIEGLNNQIRYMNLQGFIDEVTFLNSSAYYEHDRARGAQMQRENNVRGVANIYFVGDPAGACGYAPFNGDALVVANMCTGLNSTTIAHEFGHFFDLTHTFSGWEGTPIRDAVDTLPAPTFTAAAVVVEKVDGSNCRTAGDGFCDTPPDYLSERWPCNDLSEYRDSLTDPDGIRFAVSGGNIMSYSLDDCQVSFSPEQESAIYTNIARRVDFARSGPENPVSANGEDVSLLLPENNETLDFSDFVELTWSSAPNADYYVVQINTNDNFSGTVLSSFITSDTSLIVTENLIARRRYFWRVRPVNRYSVASDYSEVYRFRNGEFTVSTMDETLDAALTVSPNPLRSGQELRIAGRDLGGGGTLNYQLMDPAGRILQSREGLNVPATGFTEYLNTSDMPAGVYFLRLQLDDRLVTRRVVVW